MAKFDINNSRYAQFYSDADFLRTFVDGANFVNTNFSFWKTQFRVDDAVTPTDNKGLATFTVQSVKTELTPMMDMRAPLGKSKPIDNEGLEFYTATIPDFIAPSIVEQAMEREYKRRLFEQYGNDTAIILQWTHKVQGQIDSANQTLSNMAAQLLSTGQIDYQAGRGIKGYTQKANIPTENFVKAGETVWTDPNCKLLDQMAKIEETFRDKWGSDMPMKWQIPLKMFRENFLTNKQVIEWVRLAKSLVGITLPEFSVVTEEEVMDALAKYGKISPIEIVVEKQKDYKGMVNGWKDGIAVFRPAGYAGVIKYTDVLDVAMHENYGSSVIQKTFAKVGDSGLFTLVNTTLNNGNYKEWHTDLMVSATPALEEFPYHVIVNAKEADE